MKRRDRFDAILCKNLLAKELKSRMKDEKCPENILCYFDEIEKIMGVMNEPTGRDILTTEIDR